MSGLYRHTIRLARRHDMNDVLVHLVLQYHQQQRKGAGAIDDSAMMTTP